MVKRKALIIYYQNKKALKELANYPLNLAYQNDKAGYAVAYTDETQAEKMRKQISNLRGIRKVEESLTDMEHLHFQE